MEGATIDNLLTLYNNVDLNNENAIYALNKMLGVNKTYSSAYNFDSAQNMITVASRCQDNELTDLLIEKDMAAIKNSEPNMLSKFFGAKNEISKPRLLDDSGLNILLNKNNKEFLKEYIKTHEFEPSQNYISDNLYSEVYDTRNLPNASEMLKKPEVLEKFKAEPKKLRNLKYTHPQVYKRLEDEGIIVNNDAPDLSEAVFKHFGENSSVSPNLIKAIKNKKENVPMIKKFEYGTSEKEILSKTQCGDVFEKNFDLCVNDNGKIVKLNIDKFAFKRIFGDEIKNYDTSQGNIGNCYQVNVLNSIMANPKSRAKIYQNFSSKGGNIYITVPGFKDTDEPVKFPYGAYRTEKGKMMQGSDGLKMLEQALAVVSFDHSDGTNITAEELGQSSKVWTQFMDKMDGGRSVSVYSAYLGVESKIFTVSEKENIDKYLEKLSKGDALMSFGTIQSGDIPEIELNADLDIYSQHAYAITGYDPATKMIQYSNPHSGGKVETVKIDKILPYISTFTAADL